MSVANRCSELGRSLRRLLLPAPVVKVGFFFLADDTAAVVSVLGRLGVCHLDQAVGGMQEFLTPYFPEPFREAYRRLRDQYEPLAQRWRLTGEAELTNVPRQVPPVPDLDRLAGALAGIRERLDRLDQEGRQQTRRRDDLEQFAYYVQVLAGLGIDARALTNLRFLHVQSGMVPAENLDRLRESATLGDDLVLALGTHQGQAHILVIGVGGLSPDLEGLLTKAHFQPLAPPALSAEDDAQAIRSQVQEGVRKVQAELEQLQGQEAALRREARGPLQEAAGLLAHAVILIQCDGAMLGRPPVAFLSGWVEQERLAELDLALARDVASPVAVLHEPLREAGEESPGPSAVAVPAWFRPGAALVTLFGVPGRNELNPALVLAATTPFFFGMMFGDVGQGLILATLALAGRRWLGRWVVPALSCSLSCVVFGLLYGSVFGVEHWLAPLWLRPMSEPFRLLAAALWVGVGFLLLTFVLKAVNLALQDRWREALLGFQGGGGALCYLGGVFGLRAAYQGQSMPPAAVTLLIVGLLLSALHAYGELRRHGKAALGHQATELFHGALSMLTNTLSFLRLAAFALNHGALSMALFLLVALIPATPVGWALRILVLVAGSALILALDVLVVAVQTIRLEFYEGLTRYYRGDGKEFLPLRFPEGKTP